jgi:hypothetical protein
MSAADTDDPFAAEPWGLWMELGPNQKSWTPSL